MDEDSVHFVHSRPTRIIDTVVSSHSSKRWKFDGVFFSDGLMGFSSELYGKVFPGTYFSSQIVPYVSDEETRNGFTRSSEAH